jgi:hypothetical protein
MVRKLFIEDDRGLRESESPHSYVDFGAMHAVAAEES